MDVSSKESDKTRTDQSVVRSPVETNRENPERIDSGFESTRTEVTTKFNQGMVHDNTINAPVFETDVPWEVFLTGRKLTAAVYSRIPRDEKPTGKQFHSTIKPSLPGRSKPSLIKPVLRVELVHPALIVNTQFSGPRIQVSCFDVIVAGASPVKGKP